MDVTMLLYEDRFLHLNNLLDVCAKMTPQLGNAEDKSKHKIDTNNQLLLY